MATGAFLYFRSEDPLPASVQNPAEMMKTFQRRGTECLIISKYCTSPGLYTIEALLLNTQMEFIFRRDATLGE
jgi:hypothetical protein